MGLCEISRNGVMIDSGSTFSYLTSGEYNVFVSAFREQLRRTMTKSGHLLQEVKRFRVNIMTIYIM